MPGLRHSPLRTSLSGLLAALTLSLPAQALPQPCVSWASICVPEYVIRYLPTLGGSVDPGASWGPLVATEEATRQIASHYWPAWAVERMVRIAECESGHSPWAVNPSSGAAGIWQIMPFWKRVWPGDYFDPWTNGAIAYQIWLEQGFAAWVCRG